MRYIFLALFCIGLMQYATAQNTLDEKYGFRDIKLDASFTDFEDLKLINESNGVSYYIKDYEDLKEEGFEMQQITYGFYNSKLYFIVIQTIGEKNGKKLLDYLNKEYGEGQLNHNIADSYTWFAKKAGLVYEYKEIPEIAETYLYSKSMLIEKRKSGKQ
ncbi:MAG: hypothetical protein JXB49_11570 [Bacteroidales bacterium]|nr:hypothetical protein [Bacteroidales bacterium]